MTEKEFTEKVLELINQYNDCNEKSLDIMVSIQDLRVNDLYIFGHGCKACHIEALVATMIKNPPTHNKESVRVH